jgi:3-deoxy-D-manno-octulosonate 8-phosphate phosphatase (KDO 8-P phosphatase)
MNMLERFADISTFFFDVDGVLTNNMILILEDGKLLRQMNVRDGLAIKMALQQGYRICIITGGRSEGVTERLRALGISDIHSGIADKLEVYEDIKSLYNLADEEVLYMGDDLPDYPVMRRVGLPVCPADAAPEIAEISHYVSPLVGGAGCVRDVIEKVMRIQGKWTPDE